MCKVIQAAVAASLLMQVGLRDYEVRDMKKKMKKCPQDCFKLSIATKLESQADLCQRMNWVSTHILEDKMTIILIPCIANSTTFVMF